jgi:hypothetical protein
VRHLLGEWGGHRKAAGLLVEPDSFDAFVAGVNEAVRVQIEANPYILDPPVEVDAEVSLGAYPTGFWTGTSRSRRSEAETTGRSSSLRGCGSRGRDSSGRG